MRLEHIGIAVDDADAAAALFEALLGRKPYKAETVEREGVRTHFVAAGAAKLELLEALGPDSPVARFLERRGEGLHHVAFEVDDLDATFAAMQARGLEPLTDAPRPGADGKRIFFLHPKQTRGVLVEFCQSTGALPEPTFVGWEGGEVAVRSYGRSGRAAVLLLGAPGAGLARRLEPHAHVLALEAVGPEAARAALDHFGVARAHVFGPAADVLDLARAHPARVNRLALHGALPGDPAPVPHPTLVCADDDSAETALSLRRRLPESRLAVVPGDLLPEVLLRHFGLAGRADEGI